MTHSARQKLIWAGTASIAALAAMAIAVQRQTREAEKNYPPHGSFMTVDNVKLHYIDVGEGPPVVLLHGNGAMIADMEISGLVDALKSRHRVIVFDRPGYGYSERPRDRSWTPQAQADLLAMAIAQLELDRPVVLGHSWGTLVAIAMAQIRPFSVGGLVLASGYYYPTARADVVLLSPPAIPVLGDVMRYTIAPLIGWGILPKAVSKMFAPLEVTSRFRDQFPAAVALRPSQIRASSEETAMMIPAAAALQGEYRNVSTPTVIIAGEDDEIVETSKQSARLLEDIPGSRLIVLPRMGHMLHHFETGQVADAVTEVSHRTADIRIG